MITLFILGMFKLIELIVLFPFMMVFYPFRWLFGKPKEEKTEEYWIIF